MPREGRQPARGLEQRACVICETLFQPYRDHQIACQNRPCRDRAKKQSPRLKEWTYLCPRCGVECSVMWSGLGSRRPACETCTGEIARSKMDRMNDRRRGDPEYLARHFANNIARYGLTVDEWQAMVDRQDNRCAICGSPPTPGTGPSTQRLHIDHDHRTGKNRALLCNNCNRGLGWFKDDPEQLDRAAAYLRFHGAV